MIQRWMEIEIHTFLTSAILHFSLWRQSLKCPSENFILIVSYKVPVFINTFGTLCKLKINYEVNMDGVIYVRRLMIS